MSSGSPAFLGFQDAAAFAGHAAWFEGRLFEVLGGWAEAEEDAEAKVLFSTHSFHHAWHADLWRGLLPVSDHLRPDTLVVPAGDEVAGFVDTLAATARSGETIERLVAACRVIAPRLVSAYRERLSRADPTSDGPTSRWLRFALADETQDQDDGEQLLRRRLPGPDERTRADEWQRSLEGRVVALAAIPSPIVGAQKDLSGTRIP